MSMVASQYLDNWLMYLTSRDQSFREPVQILCICLTMGLLIHKKVQLDSHAKVPVSGISIQPDFPHIGKTSQDSGDHSIPPDSTGGHARMSQILLSLFVATEKLVPSYLRNPTLHLATLGFQSVNKVDHGFPFPLPRKRIYNGGYRYTMF